MIAVLHEEAGEEGRAEHIAEWVKRFRSYRNPVTLTGEKVAQLAPPRGKQPRDQGIRAAVHELGIDRTEAQRSIKIASIAPEAKAPPRKPCLPPHLSALTEGQLEHYQRLLRKKYDAAGAMEAVQQADQPPAPDDTPCPHARERACLRCRRPFSSAHASNRICERCTDAVQSDRSAIL